MNAATTSDLSKTDEIDLAGYRKYAAAIDRALSTFETIESWPDNIAFLNRLVKAIQTYSSMSLPKSFEVSNCLALCLSPGLPSGVHQKALEVYAAIFASAQAPEREIPLFLSGLMPVLAFASTTVKQLYATLLSDHVIPLGTVLTTYTRGIILALFPGIEDEHDEFFKVFLALMDSIREVLGNDIFFWSSYWLATASTTSTVKAGSLNYLLQRMPKAEYVPKSIRAPDLLIPFVGPDPSLIVAALSCGLTDSDCLVQRGFLEMLLMSMPLWQPQVKNLPSLQRQKLLYSAVHIVLRRDVSLNRRLWLWLAGTPETPSTSSTSLSYFQEHAKKDLIEAFRVHIECELATATRLLLSLLDRGDIGGQIIDTLFPIVMNKTYEISLLQDMQDKHISAAALFEAVPVSTILTHMVHLCRDILYDEMLFMFRSYNFSDEIMNNEVMTNIFLDLLESLATRQAAFEIVKVFMRSFGKHHLSLHVFRNASNRRQPDTARGCLVNNLPEPLCTDDDHQWTLGFLWPLACFEYLITDTSNVAEFYDVLVVRYDLGASDNVLIRNTITYISRQIERYEKTLMPFEHVRGLVKLIEALNWSDHHTILQHLCMQLFEQCWQYLGCTKLKYEISAVSLIEILVRMIPLAVVDTFFLRRTSETLRSGEPLDKFGALWNYMNRENVESLLERSTILILDTLAYDNVSAHSYILRWLRTSSERAPVILYFLLRQILLHLPHHSLPVDAEPAHCSGQTTINGNGYYELQYTLRILRMFLDRVGSEYRFKLDRAPIHHSLASQYLVSFPRTSPPDLTYTAIFLAIARRALDILDHSDDEKLHLSICEDCFEIMRLTGFFDSNTDDVELILAGKLMSACETGHLDVVHLTLTMLVYVNNQRASYKPLLLPLLDVLIAGVCRYRNHPILQDYLSYLRSRLDTEDLREVESILWLTRCIAEQVDLNLIDIDAALHTSHIMDDINTAHENTVLYLDTLGRFSSSPQQDLQKTAHASLGPTLHSFSNIVSSASIVPRNPDVAKFSEANVEESLLSSVVCAAVGVWLWATNNDTSDVPSIKHISRIFRDKSQSLLETIVSLNKAGDLFDLLIANWADTIPANRARLESLCRILLSKLVTLACSNVKSKLSFSPINLKDMKDMQANTSMSFSTHLLRHASMEEFNDGCADAIGLLRHLTMHMPSSNTVRVTLLQFITLLASNIMQTKAAQQRKTRRELSDLVAKLINGVISDSFEEKLAKVLVKDIIPQLPKIYMDLDRVASSVSSLMTQLVLPRMKARTMDSSTLEILQAIVILEGVKKTWKKDIQDFFNENHFFDNPLALSRKWLHILAVWIDNDISKVTDYINKPNPNTPGNLFTSAESERQAQAQQMRRLIVLILAMRPNALLPRLPAMENRIIELCKAGPLLQSEALMCLECILLRFSEVHLAHFWIQICIELQRCFALLISSFQPNEEFEALLVSTLSTFDLLLYQAPIDFQL